MKMALNQAAALMREKLKAEPVVAPWQIELKLIGEMGF